jgi:hypothetical protein
MGPAIDRCETGWGLYSLGSYPYEQIQQLVGAPPRMLGLTSFEVLRWFGQQTIPLLFDRFPAFFSSQLSTRPFELSVNSTIHPELRKIIQARISPHSNSAMRRTAAS